MEVRPSNAFLDLKKKQLWGEENGELGRLVISKAWLVLGCWEAPPTLGPAEAAGSGRLPLLQHAGLSLATILPGNIIKGLGLNHLSVLGVCFPDVCLSQTPFVSHRGG